VWGEVYRPLIGPHEAGRFNRPPYLAVGLMKYSGQVRLYVAFKVRLKDRWRRFNVLLWRRNASAE